MKLQACFRVLVGLVLSIAVVQSALAELRFDSFDVVSTPTHALHSLLPQPGGIFGYEVSSLEGIAVIGEPFENLHIDGGGRVHLYDTLTGQPVAAPLFNPSAAAAFFGSAIVPVGDQLLIGNSPNQTAHLFDVSNPQPVNTYHSPLPGSAVFFGNQVATLGSDLVIADSHESPQPGSVYRVNKNDGSLVSHYQSPSAPSGQIFGRALTTLGGNTVVVGAANGSGGAGSVYVFNADGTLRTFDSGGVVRNDLLTGNSLVGDFNTLAMLDDDHIVVGDKLSGTFGADAGAAYIYNVHTGEQVGGTFRAPVARAGAKFGAAVEALGDNILIGATGDTSGGVAGAGAAYLFNRSGDLLRVYENPSPHEGDNFGSALGFVDDQVLVGAPHDDTLAMNAGAAYLFEGNVPELLPSIPHFQQQDPGWGGDPYATGAFTIGEKGCALSSLSMMFHYAGVSSFRLPSDGSLVENNPEHLNELFNQSGRGFSGNMVDWLPAAITVGAASGMPELEFTYFKSQSLQVLQEKVVDEGHPVIVGVNGNKHFVIVTEKRGGEFIILDPLTTEERTLGYYGNQFETRGFVTPTSVNPPASLGRSLTPDVASMEESQSDMEDRSAVNVTLVSSSADVSVIVTDPSGRVTGFDPIAAGEFEDIPDSVHFIDGYFDAVTGDPPVEFAHFVYVPQPQVGTYEITVVGMSGNPIEFLLGVQGLSVDGVEVESMRIVDVVADDPISFDIEVNPVPEPCGGGLAIVGMLLWFTKVRTTFRCR